MAISDEIQEQSFGAHFEESLLYFGENRTALPAQFPRQIFLKSLDQEQKAAGTETGPDRGVKLRVFESSIGIDGNHLPILENRLPES